MKRDSLGHSMTSMGVELIHILDAAGIAFIQCGGIDIYGAEISFDRNEIPWLIEALEAFAFAGTQISDEEFRRYYSGAVTEARFIALQMRAGTFGPPFQQRDWTRWRENGKGLRDLSKQVAFHLAATESVVVSANREVSQLRAAEEISHHDETPISFPALYKLCVGKMNRVGQEVAGSDSTVRGWKNAKGWPEKMTWQNVRQWLTTKKDYDIGPPPTEC